ncbi:type IV secretory system conjugative DNA transfer family protein [Dokdonia sp.]|uniref:type IV secretory system conjugative DNA transfer family protein n=1 Tax=Dokdonia sp. TaxID=2024995 RepID=UPI003264FD40
MSFYDFLEASGAVLDSLLAQLVGNKNDYKGRLGSARKVLKRKHKHNGLRIGDKYVSLKQSLNGGLLLISKTGGGKSSKIFLQNLLGAAKMYPTNFICLDPTGELRDRSMPYLCDELEYEEDIINFSDASKSTITWNPIENLPQHRIHRFASELVALSSDSAPKDPIWNNLSSNLLAMNIRLLQLIGIQECINMYNVRFLVLTLQADNEKMNKLIAKYCDDSLFQDFKSFLNNDDKFLQSVLSSTLSVLNPWLDEHITKTTATTTLDMHSYRSDERKILFIQNEIMSQSYLKVLNSLFLKEWFTHITEAGIPEQGSNVIAFLIDEASSLKTSDKNFIPFISSQIRKYKSYGIWGYQSFSQCQDLLGREGAQTLKMNTGSVLYLGNQNLETAKEISQSLGKYTYMENDKKAAREVLTAEEVMYQGGAILISGSEPPIKLKKVRAYYEDKKMRKWSEIPVPDISSIIQEMPALLPIDELIKNV